MLSKTNNILIPLVFALGVVYFIVRKRGGDLEKKVGKKCVRKDGGPDGTIVFDFMTSNTNTPTLLCKRCNQSGCSSIPI